MAISTLPRTTALHTGTTGPSGSPAVSLLERDPGSMAPTISTATWITASIHIMATVVHFRDVETKPSITSAETRCVMGTATQAAEVIARNSVKLKEHRCHLAG